MLDFEALAQAMAELEEETMIELLGGVMAEGGKDADKALEACQKGMDMIGKYFEDGEYFLGDLIYAGELMNQALEILKDALAGSRGGESGTKILLCTVKDDLHDIGKNIVKAILEAKGFEVLDLGIDVSSERIVDAVRENSIRIVALSGMLTLAVDSMKATIDALKAAGLNGVKVLIGGAPVNEDVCREVGADEWAQSPKKTVSVCESWAEM